MKPIQELDLIQRSFQGILLEMLLQNTYKKNLLTLLTRFVSGLVVGFVEGCVLPLGPFPFREKHEN